jgi:acyl-coenzyme A synthetase/AMP-(fatty) acid ligase
VVDLAVVSHADAGAHHIIQRYLHAFTDRTSVAIVAPAHVAGMRKQPWLAGWRVTDCTSRFELTWPSGGAAQGSGDELIFETSGTVGDPKLVRYHKSTIRDCAEAIAQTLALDPDRDYISLANPRFAYGLSIIHSHFTVGVPVHIRSVPVSLESWAALRHRLRPNSSVYLGPHFSFLLAQDASWRLDGPIDLIFAGGAVTQSMVDRLKTSFPDSTITNMYGQAELGPRVSTGSSAIDDFHEGDVGLPLPGVRVRISAGDEGQSGGMIEVDSPFRMIGYATMTRAEPADVTGSTEATWWPTGDIGYLSDDGHLHVLGRAAGDINFLGSRLRLSDVRAVVRAVGGVVDARVSPVPHEVYGERPSIRVLVEAADDSMELAVRKALGNAMGHSAGAVLITIVDLASLPESGKL